MKFDLAWPALGAEKNKAKIVSKKMDKSSKTEMLKKISQVLVIGTSAGGLTALTKLISQLPKDFPLPVLVVRHISPDATGNIILDKLNQLNTVKCQHAKNRNKLKTGNLYLAPSDHHLLIEMARGKKGKSSQIALERVKVSQVHIDRIRAILKTAENESGNDMPT